MINWGTEEEVKRQILAHFEAGATHVCIRQVHPHANSPRGTGC